MRSKDLICLALSCFSALVQACGGHDHQVREWTQEELDELEKKWGAEVSKKDISLFRL